MSIGYCGRNRRFSSLLSVLNNHSNGIKSHSGVPLLRGTRLPADTVLSNYEAGSQVEEISDNFDMPEQTIRDLLTYAANKHKQLHP